MHTYIHTYIHNVTVCLFVVQASYLRNTYIHTYCTYCAYIHTYIHTYIHASLRKSPVVDGRVKRDMDGLEVRYPVILSSKEKDIARKIVKAFGQIGSNKSYIHKYISYSTCCTYKHIHTYIHSFIYMYILTYLHAYIHTYIHTYSAYIQYMLHIQTHTYIHTYIHSYIHVYTHIFTRLHTHTHIHTFPYIQIHYVRSCLQ